VAYLLGTALLGIQTDGFSFELSWAWVEHEFPLIWKPLVVGSLTIGLTAGITGYLLIDFLWKLNIYGKWRERKKTSK
jgi:uncharacterized protein (DUF2062 family)